MRAISVGKGRWGETVENMCTLNMKLVTKSFYVLSTGQEAKGRRCEVELL